MKDLLGYVDQVNQSFDHREYSVVQGSDDDWVNRFTKNQLTDKIAWSIYHFESHLFDCFQGA